MRAAGLYLLAPSTLVPSVTYPGMDTATGVFTVTDPGVYQITFTGFFRSKNGHMVRPVPSTPPQLSADLYLRRKGSEVTPEIIGRASAKVDENGFAGKNDTYILMLCLFRKR